LDADTLNLNREATARIKATILPYNTTNKPVEWTSGDYSIVEIIPPTRANDTICDIKALRSGTTKIYARSLDGEGLLKDSCVINVYVPVDSVVFKIDNVSISDTVPMEISDTLRLKAVVYPDTASFKSVNWTVGASDLLIIDTLIRNDTLNIIGRKKGNAKISVAVNDRGLIYKDSCVFAVEYKPIDSITLHMPDSVDIIRNEERTLSVTVAPFKATNDSVIWTSSDSSIVDILSTADTICRIQAKNLGRAKIYVTSKVDPLKKDSCVFTVLPIPVTRITLSRDSLDLYPNNPFRLIAITEPLNATEKSLRWTSSDSAIVDIVSSADTICEIMAKSLGEAKIYAVAPDGGAKDSCVVTVEAQYIFLSSDTANVNGHIELSVVLPANNETLTASFMLQLPNGFGLAYSTFPDYMTSLVPAFKDLLDLAISRVNDSTYVFSIVPKPATTSNIPLTPGTKTKIMDIVYTIYNSSLKDSKENYTASIVDVTFEWSNDTIFEERKIDVVIKAFEDPTGNVVIINPVNNAYISDGRLYVNTEQAETISVYSLNGSLLFTGNKNAGLTVFDLKTPETILIVRGSAGWVNKVVNR